MFDQEFILNLYNCNLKKIVRKYLHIFYLIFVEHFYTNTSLERDLFLFPLTGGKKTVWV